MNHQIFPVHAEQQRLLADAMQRIRERNAQRRAEVAIAKAQGKVATFGWEVLTNEGKPAAHYAGKK